VIVALFDLRACNLAAVTHNNALRSRRQVGLSVKTQADMPVRFMSTRHNPPLSDFTSVGLKPPTVWMTAAYQKAAR
jgi:hypothetical protein